MMGGGERGAGLRAERERERAMARRWVWTVGWDRWGGGGRCGRERERSLGCRLSQGAGRAVRSVRLAGTWVGMGPLNYYIYGMLNSTGVDVMVAIMA